MNNSQAGFSIITNTISQLISVLKDFSFPFLVILLLKPQMHRKNAIFHRFVTMQLEMVVKEGDAQAEQKKPTKNYFMAATVSNANFIYVCRYTKYGWHWQGK